MTRRDKLKTLLDAQRKAILHTRNNVIEAIKDPTLDGIEGVDELLSQLINTNVSIAALLEVDDVVSFDDIIRDAKEINFLENLYLNSPGESES